MDIYTSYFAKLNQIEEKFPNILPIGIAGKLINGFKYQHFKQLAPSWSIWKEWHDSTYEYKDYRYQLRFFNEVLSKIDKFNLMLEFQDMINNYNKALDRKYDSVVMLCYEKPQDFCHRHIVSEWLRLDYPQVVKGELEL